MGGCAAEVFGKIPFILLSLQIIEWKNGSRRWCTKDFAKSNNNSQSLTHVQVRQPLSSVSLSLCVSINTHTPLSLCSPALWGVTQILEVDLLLRNSLQIQLRNSPVSVPRSRRWEGHGSHLTLSMPWLLFSWSPVLPYDISDRWHSPTCSCLPSPLPLPCSVTHDVPGESPHIITERKQKQRRKIPNLPLTMPAPSTMAGPHDGGPLFQY